MSTERDDRLRAAFEAAGGDIGFILDRLQALSEFVVPLGSEFLLDPNEVNAWAVRGMIDDRHAISLGNTDADNLSRLAGGLIYPFDVRIKALHAYHRNSDNDAQAWGWVVARVKKTAASNSQTTDFILHESQENGNVGPRDYGNNVTQLTDIDLSQRPESLVPAGETIILGVAAPTAVTANRFVQIMSGYIHIERVFN